MSWGWSCHLWWHRVIYSRRVWFHFTSRSGSRNKSEKRERRALRAGPSDPTSCLSRRASVVSLRFLMRHLQVDHIKWSSRGTKKATGKTNRRKHGCRKIWVACMFDTQTSVFRPSVFSLEKQERFTTDPCLYASGELFTVNKSRQRWTKWKAGKRYLCVLATMYERPVQKSNVSVHKTDQISIACLFTCLSTLVRTITQVKDSLFSRLLYHVIAAPAVQNVQNSLEYLTVLKSRSALQATQKKKFTTKKCFLRFVWKVQGHRLRIPRHTQQNLRRTDNFW